MPRLDLPADENIQLEELEEFAKEFKQRRIKLGYTQVIYSTVSLSILKYLFSALEIRAQVSTNFDKNRELVNQNGGFGSCISF